MDKKTFLNRMANNIEIIESHIGYIESIFLTKDYAQIISEKVNLKYNFSEKKLEAIPDLNENLAKALIISGK